MKLVSYEIGGKASYGVVAGDGVIDAGARLPHADLVAALRAGGPDELRGLAGEKPDHGLADIAYLPPAATPEKIICIGVNYGSTIAQLAEKRGKPAYPNVFMRSRDSLVGHNRPIIRPPESEQLDYEGEIGIVIGKPGRRIPEAEAYEHVAGLTCVNEGTIRDWMRHGEVNITQGKNFDRSGAAGPWLVTLDEVGDLDRLHLTTRVNGEVRQDSPISKITFGFRYLINYLSTITTLQPGDLICTGTPSGSGASQKPPQWLKAGHEVAVEVKGVGTLANRVVDED